jgi:hypothetical protein
MYWSGAMLRLRSCNKQDEKTDLNHEGFYGRNYAAKMLQCKMDEYFFFLL